MHNTDELLSELRERNRELERVNDELRHRTEAQSALAAVARALGASLHLREVVEAVTTHSVDLTDAFGAYLERIESPGPEGTVEIVAVAGRGVPPPGTRVPYPGSLTDAIIESGEPELITEVGAIGENMVPYLRESCGRCTGLIVPLASDGEVLGAIVLLRGPGQKQFTAEETGFIRALGDAASAALRRVLLLEELQESEERFRSLAENATDAIATIDEDDRIVYVNPATAEIFGYPADELYGRPFTTLIPEQFRQQHVAGIRRYLETGQRHIPWDGVELPGLHRSGREIPLEITFGEYVRDRRHFFTGIMRDVTERKRVAERTVLLGEASRVLASSLEFEETLNRVARLAVPTLGDYCLIDVLDITGELRRVGVAHRDPDKEAAIRAVERYAPDWESLSPAITALHTAMPQIVPEFTEFLLEVTGQTPEHRALVRFLAPRSGIVAPLHARDRILGVLWLVWAESDRQYSLDDVVLADEIARRTSVFIENSRLFQETRTARLEAEWRAAREEALRRAAAAVGAAVTIEETVRQIAQSALMSTEADGVLVEQIDWRNQEVEVAAVAGERTVPFGTRVKYSGSLAETIVETGKPEIISDLAAADDRISRELRDAFCGCHVLGVPLIDAVETIGVLMLLREPEKEPFRPEEITDASVFADLASLAFRKVRMLQQTEQQRDELARVMESRARLVRGFSHDVKNPLGAADGYLQLMEEEIVGPLSDKQKGSVVRARRSIGAALRLILDLTELARAETGTIEVRHEAVDLRSVVLDVVEEYRAGAEAEGLTMNVEIPDKLPIIESDAARVRQILGNLLSNATKYTRQGGITVRCALSHLAAAPCPGPCERVDVSDTGPGISEEEQQLVFREFTRLGGAGRAPGAGIGLAISKKLAEMLGGSLTVKSEVGAGSTFTLWLPLAQSHPS